MLYLKFIFSPLRLQFPLFRLLFLFLGGLHLLNYLDIADLSIDKTRFFKFPNTFLKFGQKLLLFLNSCVSIVIFCLAKNIMFSSQISRFCARLFYILVVLNETEPEKRVIITLVWKILILFLF